MSGADVPAVLTGSSADALGQQAQQYTLSAAIVPARSADTAQYPAIRSNYMSAQVRAATPPRLLQLSDCRKF